MQASFSLTFQEDSRLFWMINSRFGFVEGKPRQMIAFLRWMD
jgi:hypothetical protein